MLRVSLAGVVRTCVAHGPILRAIYEAVPFDGRMEAAWRRFMGGWDDAVAARAELQQRDGRIPPSLDARRVARALNAMNAAVLIAEFGHRPQGDPDAVLDALHRIWEGALYGQAPGEEADEETMT